MAASALAGCSAGSGAKAEPAAKWGFERDDDLPLLCMEVSGGSVVAATGDGWAPNGDFVQLHLGGGSIPGTQVKSVTSETDGTRLTVVLESGGVSTLDLVWTEWRLTPPAGVDVALIMEYLLDDGRVVLTLGGDPAHNYAANYATIPADAFLNGSTEYTEMEFLG